MLCEFVAQKHNLSPPENLDWEGYAVSLLRSLKGMDKSGWHHRIVFRVGSDNYSLDTWLVLTADCGHSAGPVGQAHWPGQPLWRRGDHISRAAA